MLRSPTSAEKTAASNNPTIAYKLVKVRDGKYFSMNVRPDSPYSKELEYAIGKVTVTVPGTRGLACYLDKDRALKALPHYDKSFRGDCPAALLKVAVVGQGMGFRDNKPHQPLFSAVIPLAEVWVEELPWKDVTKEVKVKLGFDSKAGAVVLVSYKNKVVAKLGCPSRLLVSGNYMHISDPTKFKVTIGDITKHTGIMGLKFYAKK